MIELDVPTEESMIELGKKLSGKLRSGDLMLLEGELGAGKTTLVRAILRGLGWQDEVRSPTFNLFSVYETDPPVLHADLYRVASPFGTGLEDYLDTHLCLVEWPKEVASWADESTAIRVQISFNGSGRKVRLSNIEG